MLQRGSHFLSIGQIGHTQVTIPTEKYPDKEEREKQLSWAVGTSPRMSREHPQWWATTNRVKLLVMYVNGCAM